MRSLSNASIQKERAQSSSNNFSCRHHQDPEPQTDLLLESPLNKEDQQQEAHSRFRPADLRTWVVEVELALERLGLLLWGEDPVETVLAEDGHLPLVVVDFVLPEQLHDLAAHRRLATQEE